MKKALILVVFAIVFFHGATLSVQAHILKTDGTIGAVLHIDPEDDPVVGQQAGFFFEFKDKQNKFKPANCNCTFSIIEDGKELYSQPLFQNNTNPGLTSATLFFIFPEKNVYQIKVLGKPLTSNEFQPFTLAYNLRVTRETNTQSSPSWLRAHLISLVIISALFLFAVIKLAQQKRKSK